MKIRLILIVLLSAQFTGFSQEPKEQASSVWQFDLAPYLLFSGVSGDVRSPMLRDGEEVEFSDTFGNLKTGFGVHAEGRKDRWSIITDLILIALGNDDQIAVLGDDFIASENAQLDVDQILFELAGGYNIVNAQDWLLIDVIAGIRYFDLSTRVSLDTRPLEEMNRSDSGIDPIFGIRFTTVSDQWINSARIDAGGFGAGSEVSWKANLLLGYRFGELFSVIGGLQGYGLDYRKDNFRLDIIQAGFVLGGNFRF